MDTLRSWIGIQAAPSAAAKPKPHAALARRQANTTPHDDRAAALERAQARQLACMQAEMEEHERIISTAPVGSAIMRRAMVDKRALDARIRTHQAKLDNLRTQRSVTNNATANIEQALLVQQGADELASANAAMEQLDVAAAVDRLADAASEMRVHDDLLATPMFGDVQPLVDEDDIQAEMDAIRAAREEQQDREAAARMMGAPDAPSTTPAVATAAAAAATAVKSDD